MLQGGGWRRRRRDQRGGRSADPRACSSPRPSPAAAGGRRRWRRSPGDYAALGVAPRMAPSLLAGAPESGEASRSHDGSGSPCEVLLRRLAPPTRSLTADREGERVREGHEAATAGAAGPPSWSTEPVRRRASQLVALERWASSAVWAERPHRGRGLWPEKAAAPSELYSRAGRMPLRCLFAVVRGPCMTGATATSFSARESLMA